MQIKISEALKNLPRIDYRALKPFQQDLKDLSERDYKKVVKSLSEFGFIVPMFVWNQDGACRIMDGHQRHRVLMKEQIEPFELPYIEIEAATEQEAKKKLLVISSQYGKITQEGLDTFAFDIEDGWLKETTKFDALFEYKTEKEPTDSEPQIDQAEELNKKWQVKTGDLFQIGNHRLLCGDSTKTEDVQRLMNGEVAALMVTDPPYGVELDQSWRDKALGDKAMGPGNKHKVESDDRADWTVVWSLFGGDVAYVWHADKFSDVVMTSLRNVGLEPCQQLIWNKSIMVMGRSDYHFKHEPCWYAVRKGKPHLWVGDRTQTSVIEAKSPNHIMAGSTEEKTDHPTQKPIDCFMMIANHESEFVYDPFLGSGTTMVACQNLNRKCRGIEISPNYCAVILERMYTAFPTLDIKKVL